jgi:hypothetical protein
MIAYASGHVVEAQRIVGRIESVILFPIMSFMLSLALLYFLWGAYEFVRNAESDEGRTNGKVHMMYGIIGMLVMISAMAILKIAAGTFGVSVPN